MTTPHSGRQNSGVTDANVWEMRLSPLLRLLR